MWFWKHVLNLKMLNKLDWHFSPHCSVNTNGIFVDGWCSLTDVAFWEQKSVTMLYGLNFFCQGFSIKPLFLFSFCLTLSHHSNPPWSSSFRSHRISQWMNHQMRPAGLRTCSCLHQSEFSWLWETKNLDCLIKSVFEKQGGQLSVS